MPTIVSDLQNKHFSKPLVSSLDLMTIIFKINSILDKTSFQSYVQKKQHMSIFQMESSKHKSLKMNEASSVFSLAILSVGANVCSHLSTNMLQTSLKILSSASPIFTQSLTSIFQSYEIMHQSKKQIANIESDANKELESKLDQQVQQNLEKLQTCIKNIDSLNHLR